MLNQNLVVIIWILISFKYDENINAYVIEYVETVNFLIHVIASFSEELHNSSLGRSAECN